MLIAAIIVLIIGIVIGLKIGTSVSLKRLGKYEYNSRKNNIKNRNNF